MQVIALMVIESGAKITKKNKKELSKWIKLDDWATEDDERKDNIDDQITLDRFTLQAQQTLYNTSKTTIIDYSCGQLERKVD